MNKTINILAILVLVLLGAVMFVYLYPGVPAALQTLISSAFSGGSGALFLALHSSPFSTTTTETTNKTVTLVSEPSTPLKDDSNEKQN